MKTQKQKREDDGAKHFYYLSVDLESEEKNILIRITAKRKPSATTKPAGRETWIISQLSGGEFVQPSFPEITWGNLSKCQFIGFTVL